jgi:hypothetical protein
MQNPAGDKRCSNAFSGMGDNIIKEVSLWIWKIKQGS